MSSKSNKGTSATSSTNAPTRAGSRSLREKVLEKTTTKVSTAASTSRPQDQMPSPPPSVVSSEYATPPPNVLERVMEWRQADPEELQTQSEHDTTSVVSETESIGSTASTNSNAKPGRRSMLFTTRKGTGVEMDLATKAANTMLQQGKEALELASTMKKEYKLTVMDCLQSLYETVLSLSDSRSRHKCNLEKERTRHAQELVRMERTHTKTVAKIVEDFNKTASVVKSNAQETVNVRKWLEFETVEPHRQIKQIDQTTQELQKQLSTITEELRRQKNDSNQAELATITEKSNKIMSEAKTIQSQLDEMRKGLSKIETRSASLAKDLREEINKTPLPHLDIATDHSQIQKELEGVQKSLNNIDKGLANLNSRPETSKPSADITEQLKPINERLKVVTSELRTIREQKQDTPTPTLSLSAEMAIAEIAKQHSNTPPTYAHVASIKPVTPPPRRPNHSLIITPTDKSSTSDAVIKIIRTVLDPKRSGARVDRLRKAKNQKIILTCATKENLKLVEERLHKTKALKAETAKNNNPLVIIRDVMAYHTDAELVEHILAQNKNILEGVDPKDKNIRVRYRKRARNNLECHPILEVSPILHKNMIEAGKLYIDLQRRPVFDHSPLVQCTKCLGFGHTKAICQDTKDLCSHCGDPHSWTNCPARKEGTPPSCINCRRQSKEQQKASTTTRDPHAHHHSDYHHNAFSEACPTRQRLKIVQANLQRSKLATAELMTAAKERGIAIALVQEPYVGSAGAIKHYAGTKVIQCTLNRTKPVKSAVIVFDDRLEVIVDPQLVTETEATATIRAGRSTLGLISVYYEGDQDIEHNITRTKSFVEKLRTDKVLIGGDVNAWSHWWGSSSEDQRGTKYSAFLDEIGYHILNIGDTPTFETYRRGKLYSSIVDVTACSLALLGRIEEWKVNKNLTTSDHNAVTFTLRLQGNLTPLKPQTTRTYNTRKARWSEFRTLLQSLMLASNISKESIEEIQSQEDLETAVDTYLNNIKEAAEQCIPKVGTQKGKPVPPWWNPSLAQQQQEVLRRKRRIRNAAPIRRQHVVEEYQSAKSTYILMAEEAQTTSWKDFCTKQDRESMWDGIYRVIRRTSKAQENPLLRNTEGITLSPEDSAELLAKTFYPDDSTETDSQYHTKLRETVEENQPGFRTLQQDDPPFTSAELDRVLLTQNPRKAPGPDGFTSDICAEAIKTAREVFLALANKCLSLEYFPKPWKTAHVVILRKPGKEDYTHPKSYRPIGLLSVFGKIVEKLLIGRIQWHILPTLHPNQYGFMPQRGTEDALYDLVSHIKEEVRNKKMVLLVSLDIEGAFDNAWWPALKHQLGQKKCPKNLYNTVCSYLRDRKVIVNYARAAFEKPTTKGCVQGSIGGPTFWNTILDSLLQQLSGEGTFCQAFADDVVLVFSATSTESLEIEANRALHTVIEWGQNNKLNFAAHKTHAMLLTRKLKFTPPKIYMAGNNISLVEEIKILGLIIDKSLTFNTHTAAVCKKAADIYKQLACTAKVTWGLNAEIIRTIYISVIEPIIMYASNVWAPATELNMIRDTLTSVQRCFALKICRAYRTVSLTSALTLAGLIPLDLRIQEAASLYKIKKGLSQDYLPPGKELQGKVNYTTQPHPSNLKTIEYELLENMNEDTITTHNITGPQIYTDGSKIEGKTGAAVTWWEKGNEVKFSTHSLDTFCTVFQSELYALHRATKLAESSNAPIVNILSDSRSSLELLKNPVDHIVLTRTIRQSINNIQAQGREIRLFWLRAHVGTAGNERADELAKKAALTPTSAPEYDKVPLSYAKRKIREETIKKWQDRYEASNTGKITKSFFKDIDESYRIIRSTKLKPTHVQAFTGHGGIGEYLHRFKIINNPGCECDPNIKETVWHVLLECPRFGKQRMDLEIKLDISLLKENTTTILKNKTNRAHLLEYMDTVMINVAKRHGKETASSDRQEQQPTPQGHGDVETSPVLQKPKSFQFADNGERGEPKLRTRAVVLFMNTNYERLGIGFCYASGRQTVSISPGVALLLKGSTSKATMKRKDYEALSTVTTSETESKLLRVKDKTILLLEHTAEMTPFAQASLLLRGLAETSEDQPTVPRIISIDAMTVNYTRGEVIDYLGCIKASLTHEVVVYEDRGQDLSYLKTPPPTATPSPPQRLQGLVRSPTAGQSGAEKLQEMITAERKLNRPRTSSSTKPNSSPLLKALSKVTQKLLRAQTGREKLRRNQEAQTEVQATATEEFHRRDETRPAKATTKRTKADMGQTKAPTLKQVVEPVDHMVNAFLEYTAIQRAIKDIEIARCKKILEAYHHSNEGLLKVRLEEANATIYNNDTSEVIRGKETPSHSAAYNLTEGIIPLDKDETQNSGVTTYHTPPTDPIVVTTQGTEIWLVDSIMERARQMLAKDPCENWVVPEMEWVNGVPGCGKTTWIVDNYNASTDTIVTVTKEAKRELIERLTSRVGSTAWRSVRTMASVLANGPYNTNIQQGHRVLIDEALMNHLGAIVMVTRLLRANKVILLGDDNQVPYIDRDNLFRMEYLRPYSLTKISAQLLCTRRCPMDVAYALNNIYKGIYSSSSLIRSYHQASLDTTAVPPTQPNTLYLTHTQIEKADLINKGYGSGLQSKVLTIHEAQGLNCESVIIMKTSSKRLPIHDSIPHAVVAISRHTKSCAYYTREGNDDAISKLIKQATTATAKAILDYNLKMAIKARDEAVTERVVQTITSAHDQRGHYHLGPQQQQPDYDQGATNI